MSLAQQLEAVLFSSGKKLSVEELAQMVGSSKPKVKTALSELKEGLAKRDTSLVVFNEGDIWKLTVKEEHMPLVRSIVAETELPKAVLETLAVIAWRAPILQSDIIKLRNNKAYDHIKELVDAEFIAKERYGRSYKLKLTQKFEEYFDVDDIQKLRKQLEKDLKVPQNVPEQEEVAEIPPESTSEDEAPDQSLEAKTGTEATKD